MRQTEVDGARPATTGHPEGRSFSLELPLSLPARAQDGACCRVVVSQEQALIERPVAGQTCTIRMPVSEFEGVAAAFLAAGPSLRLIHRDPGLTLDLLTASSPGAAIELRDRLARALGLPALFVDADGTVFGGSRQLRPLTMGKPKLRRGARPALTRRPRFLKRRAVGAHTDAPPLTGREIIARS